MNSNLRVMKRPNDDRSVGAIVHELADEGKSFIGTRVAMFLSEMRENLKEWRAAFPMLMTGAVFLGTAWLVLTGALVSLIAAYLAPNPLAIAIACFIVGGGYFLLGGLLCFLGTRALRGQSLVPQRTMKVLKQDAEWFQREKEEMKHD